MKLDERRLAGVRALQDVLNGHNIEIAVGVDDQGDWEVVLVVERSKVNLGKYYQVNSESLLEVIKNNE